MITITSLVSLVSLVSGRATYPPGCSDTTFPNSDECYTKNWYLGPDARDSCAPFGPYPVNGEQVYIQDAVNFCLLLPDPNSPTLKNIVYSQGRLPTILDGEGYAQAYCMGDHFTPGAFPMPKGGIRSAHVIKGVSKSGKRYIEISGTMDCGALGINCTASAPGAYDDGGQYDNVPFINCGKLPYSGVDTSVSNGMIDYVMQAGNGIFCMRVCDAGLEQNDPCNVKDDTKGCMYTMGITTFNVPGFETLDRATGQKISHQVDLPPLTPGAVNPDPSAGGGGTKTSSRNSEPTTSIKSNGDLGMDAIEGFLIGAAGAVAMLV